MPILVIGIAGMINEVSDKILLRYFLPDRSTAEAQIGIYGANYKLAILMMLFIQMFRYAAEPFFFQGVWKGRIEKHLQPGNDLLCHFHLVRSSWVFHCTLTSSNILSVRRFGLDCRLFRLSWQQNLFLGVFYNLSVWYKLTNKTLYGAIIAIMGASHHHCNECRCSFRKIGYMGSAWANFACYATIMLISFLWGRRIYRVDYNLKKIGLYTLLAVGLFAINSTFRLNTVLLQLTLNSCF